MLQIEKSQKRDLYLDFYRGIAAISIIFIHTVYWSGEGYVPDDLRTLALLLDVPFFVFLSGWSVYYISDVTKIFDNIIRTWLQYILFISFIDIIDVGFFHGEKISLSIWLGQCFFYVKETLLNFRVVRGSMWFLPMWIPVMIIGGTISIFLGRYDTDRKIIKRILLFFLIGIVAYSTGRISNYFLCSNIFCFYMLFFMLGYYFANIYVRWTWLEYLGRCAILICLWLLFSRIFQIPPKDLQNSKFPPNTLYLAASLLSVTTAIFFRGKRNLDKTVEKSRLLVFIGRNALCFYFAQGVGSSLLFHIYPVFLPMGWGLALTICFAINLVTTLLLGTMMACFYRLINVIFQIYISKYLKKA